MRLYIANTSSVVHNTLLYPRCNNLLSFTTRNLFPAYHLFAGPNCLSSRSLFTSATRLDRKKREVALKYHKLHGCFTSGVALWQNDKHLEHFSRQQTAPTPTEQARTRRETPEHAEQNMATSPITATTPSTITTAPCPCTPAFPPHFPALALVYFASHRAAKIFHL